MYAACRRCLLTYLLGLLVSSRVGARLLPPIKYYRFRPCLGLSCAWPCGFCVLGCGFGKGLESAWWARPVALKPFKALVNVGGMRMSMWRVAGGSTLLGSPSRLRAAAVMSPCAISSERRSAGGSRCETITINHTRLQPVRSPNSPNTGSDVERPKHDARARARAVCPMKSGR